MATRQVVCMFPALQYTCACGGVSMYAYMYLDPCSTMTQLHVCNMHACARVLIDACVSVCSLVCVCCVCVCFICVCISAFLLRDLRVALARMSDSTECSLRGCQHEGPSGSFAGVASTPRVALHPRKGGRPPTAEALLHAQRWDTWPPLALWRCVCVCDVERHRQQAPTPALAPSLPLPPPSPPRPRLLPPPLPLRPPPPTQVPCCCLLWEPADRAARCRWARYHCAGCRFCLERRWFGVRAPLGRPPLGRAPLERRFAAASHPSRGLAPEPPPRARPSRTRPPP